MSVLETIHGLIESAKKLRTIAEEMGSVDLKSQIVDQMFQLQEALEEIVTTGEENIKIEHETRVQESPPEEKALGSGKIFTIQPPTESETYSFEPKPEPEPTSTAVALVTESSENDQSEGKPGQDTGPPHVDAFKLPENVELTEEQQAELSELKIKELEPRHQACIQTIYEILTPEQRTARDKAKKVGKEKGLKGSELKNFVQWAVKLTDDQKKQMKIAQKELLAVREEIAKQISGMLTDEQKSRIRTKTETGNSKDATS
jgi:hypothetical protein